MLLTFIGFSVLTACAPMANTFVPATTSPAYPVPSQIGFPSTGTPLPYPPPPVATATPVKTSSIFIPPTPTPQPSGFVPPSPVISTVTIYAIRATYDLSPTLPLEQKSEIIVRRADGSYDKYLAPPELLIADLPLEEGDAIVQISSPPANFGKHPEAAPTAAIGTSLP
jgi:hypothetical protein